MTRPLLERPWSAPALLLIAAVALRCWDFGNPIIHVDEQYYLLVGDRMLGGAVPYVDIWDRKPIGLFLLFAGFRLLPGDGILAYQLAATVAAWTTALLVTTGAKAIGANLRGAVIAGAVYLIMLSLLGGRGGQAPVFYNFLMAAAGVLVLRLPGRDPRGIPGRDSRGIIVGGCLACLLAGIAIQMKYTPAVEGAFFGLAHGWALYRKGTRTLAMTAALGLWAVIGIAPTLAAICWYWRMGALDAFWFANFTSIALRPAYPLGQVAMRLLGIVAQGVPLIMCAVIGWRGHTRVGTLAYAWLAAAVIGFAAIGTFFDHYALPLLVPLSIVAAPVLGRSARAAVAVSSLALTLWAVERATLPDDAPGARQVAAIVAANSGGECPYVFIGDTATYLLSRTCLPTAYAFPNLLAYSTEQGATGIDEAAEVRRILAHRPPVIVTSTRRLSIWNPGSIRAVKATLARDYRLVFTTRRSSWRTAVYLRRDRGYIAPTE